MVVHGVVWIAPVTLTANPSASRAEKT